MDEWLGESSTNLDYIYGENNELSNIRLDFSRLKKKTYSSCDGMEVEFNYSYTFPSGFSIVETKFTQRAYISLKSPNSYSFDEFRILLSKLQNLLCFATDHTVSLTSVTGYSSKNTHELDNGKAYAHPIQIFYESIPTSGLNVRLNQRNMLLPFPVISDRFDSILMRWFNGYDQIQHALDRFFSVKLGTSEHLEIKFLLLVQGIEILHRQKFDHSEMNHEEFKTLIDAVVKCAPENKQEWIRNKLRFANEPSLRRRLKDMIEPYFYLYKTNGDINSFVNSIVDTRNYLTHNSSDLKSKSAEGKQLYISIRYLEALFQLILLQFIGMGREEIANIAEDYRSIRDKLDGVC